MKTSTLFFSLLIVTLSSCSSSTSSNGWRVSKTMSSDADTFDVAIPYVDGDPTGELTHALIYAIQTLPNVSVHDSAPYVLSVTILDDREEKIGYRYDPRDHNKKIIPSENRTLMLVSVCLKQAGSDKMVAGPGYILGNVDYDHENSSINSNILAHSLGQLADIDTAQDVTYIPLYRDLSNKIASWLQNCRDISDEGEESQR